MDIPTGFQPIFRTSPVLDLIGPLHSHGAGESLVVGMRVEAKHCNGRGTVHGGMLATLADVALGYATAFSSDPPLGLVTASLNMDFAGSARIGEWLETRVEIQKKGSRLAFANCTILAGEQHVAHASAVFMVAGSLPPAAATGKDE